MSAKGKVRDMLKLLADDGWVKVHQVGSHRQFKHPTKPGRVTVRGKESVDIHVWLWNSMLRQAGLKK